MEKLHCLKSAVYILYVVFITQGYITLKIYCDVKQLPSVQPTLIRSNELGS